MDAQQRYELIRPILDKQKTVQNVHQESGLSVRTLRRYLSRFRKGGEPIESLADKSSAAHSHPQWFTEEQQALVVQYKLENLPISARQIARDLAAKGILKISDRSVINILSTHDLTDPFFSTQRRNARKRRHVNRDRFLPSLVRPLKHSSSHQISRKPSLSMSHRCMFIRNVLMTFGSYSVFRKRWALDKF